MVSWTTFSISAAVVILFLFIGSQGMGLFSSRDHFPLSGRTAVVTGGSQGLGLSVAKLLAAKGANVYIVAQDVTKLQQANEQISAAAKSLKIQRFNYLSFDLRNPASAVDILEKVTSWNDGKPPDIVWNCAGNCLPSFFASAPIDTLRLQMDTVYWSAAYMAHAALNAWTASPSDAKAGTGQGVTHARHLIFTSSTLAFFPVAGYAPYSPAKAAMKSLADTLTQEVAVYNGAASAMSPQSAEIKVHTLFPMGIRTPGFDNENRLKPSLTVDLEKDDDPQYPDEVARIAVERLGAGESNITTMFIGHLLRGVGMGAAARNGIFDLFWNMLGGLAILFVGPDFVRKCFKWGKEKGIDGGTIGVNT